MQFLIDPQAGFCPGVQRAIDLAEKALQSGAVYCYGPLVHNPDEVERLQRLGLATVQQMDETIGRKSELAGKRVLIRSHGVARRIRMVLKETAAEMIDATCPIVARLQKLVAEKSLGENEILIVGKKGHPEVIGLLGHSNGRAKVLQTLNDAESVSANGKKIVVAQTTAERSLLIGVRDRLIRRGIEVEAFDTTCRSVNRRLDLLQRFAAEVDVVLVVGGKESSNTGVLHAVCERTNPRSYRIQEPAECRNEWFEQAERIGITGGLSTPRRQLEQVCVLLEKRFISRTAKV
ncbi:4-hydroxy-3-methylbut-2-enyl diphosphate reductase [candidate division KSB1 bacterium]|nr:4-hydroxy-3-methylbut-2-enyl diphosphate reductase [candidate division KSB1 bacterium]